MSQPTADRLATLVRFHAQCRPDSGCETCEVLAALARLGEALCAVQGEQIETDLDAELADFAREISEGRA